MTILNKMGDKFSADVLQQVVALLCQNIGWDSSQTTALDILGDITRRQILHYAKSAHNYAEHYGRTVANLDDVALVFRDNSVSVSELEEYVQNFDPVTVPSAQKIPPFPVKRESKLNFLRPGSEEMLTRPVHVHEYMPPMIFESKKEEDANPDEEQVPPCVDVEMKDPDAEASMRERSPEKEPEPPVHANHAYPEENGQEEMESSEDEIEALQSKSPGSKGFVPFSSLVHKQKRGHNENPALKRVRMMLEEDGHPLREITSVMMTTSGFLTSSREGRLPDTRKPANCEFFDALPPPPPEKKKKGNLSMKRIVDSIKKPEKENDLDQEGSDKEEVALFAKPDKISTTRSLVPSKSSTSITISTAKELKEAKKQKRKLRLDSKMMRKLAVNLALQNEQEQKKIKLFKKHSKLILDKSKKHKMKSKSHQDLDNIESDEAFDRTDEHGTDPVAHFSQRSLIMPPIPRMKKGKMGLVDPLKIKKFKKQSLAFTQHQPLIHPAKLGFPPVKKRGRPKKQPIFLPPPPPMGGMTLPESALANLGRGLMEDRPLKIKKSHMEPDMRSLIPEVQLDIPSIIPPPGLKHGKKLPRMQPAHTPPGFEPFLNMGLSATPGLIPTASKSHIPPPPPLIKMPTPSPPSLQGAPQQPQKEKMTAFGNMCSSLTITPIDMGGSASGGGGKQRVQVPPSMSSPPPPPALKSKPKPKEKSPSVLPVALPTSSSSGITITPIVIPSSEQDYDQDDYDEEYENPQPRSEKSMLAKLDETLTVKTKDKEQRKRDKERKKEMKKEKRKKDKKDKDKKKSKKDKEGKEALSVPKLTLKISQSGTPTPVDSPNPPPVYVGLPEPSPPIKFTIKSLEEPRRSPSPELAMFSPLVTRPPKPGRAAKAHAAAAVAAEAMGTFAQQQMFPPIPKKTGSKGKKDKSGKPKGSGGLVTETVGCIVDEAGNKIWICPSCGRQDDGSPMVGCDACDDWYHFPCVGITEDPPEDSKWFCPRCRKKKKKGLV